ncbi:hypothetical protein HHI36_005371, partial [Cryptolaemus montrouzieri]
MAILDEKLDRNTEDIVAEIRERECRARNIIVHNISESASASLEERIQHDRNVISKLVELVNIREDDIEKIKDQNTSSENNTTASITKNYKKTSYFPTRYPGLLPECGG